MPTNESSHLWRSILTFDWYDGPVTGVYRCERCDLHAWMALQAFEPDTQRRAWAALQLGDKAARALVDLLGDARDDKWEAARPRAEQLIQTSLVSIDIIVATSIDAAPTALGRAKREVIKQLRVMNTVDGAVDTTVEAFIRELGDAVVWSNP